MLGPVVDVLVAERVQDLSVAELQARIAGCRREVDRLLGWLSLAGLYWWSFPRVPWSPHNDAPWMGDVGSAPVWEGPAGTGIDRMRRKDGWGAQAWQVIW